MLSTIVLYVTLAFAALALVLSFCAFQLTLRLNRNERDFRSLKLAIATLDDNHAALHDSHKRLRSRVGMRELREKRKNGSGDVSEPAGDENPDEWKRQMRVKLHRGELKP